MNVNKNKPCALITGITGMDGSHLADLLLNRGYFVVGMKRRSSSVDTKRVNHIYDDPNFVLEYGNMTDTHSLWRIINKYKPSLVFNMAAQSHVRVSFEVPEETLDVVANGTLKLLNVYRELVPHARFYQASSSEMFGANEKLPHDENTTFKPASPYACAKVAAHHLCQNYRESYGLHISCGILFNHCSFRRGETFVTKKISNAAARIKLGKQDVVELGNLDAKRDWGWAPDYMNAAFEMTQQEQPDDYVIATGESYSVREYLEKTFEIAGIGDPYKYVKTATRLFRPQEVPHLLGDPSKARERLQWAPTVSFDELVENMYHSEFDDECGL